VAAHRLCSERRIGETHDPEESSITGRRLFGLGSRTHCCRMTRSFVCRSSNRGKAKAPSNLDGTGTCQRTSIR
jgi:hypothetical protein